nr:VPLPA-CTERM-specific exosortase XrtD [Roseivivax sediminis]
MFFTGLSELAEQWATPTFSHGPVVLAVSVWLFGRALRDDAAAHRDPPFRTSRLGVALVAGGLVGGLAGRLVGIGDVAAYGLLLWAVGAILVVFGRERTALLWVPLSLLALALPLPEFLYWKLTTVLQDLSSQVAVEMVRSLGLPVYRYGNVIDLGPYQLEVAEACAGLEYLLPTVVFAVLFATLANIRFWQRVQLVALAAPLVIFLNALRVTVIALLVDRYGPGMVEGGIHAMQGWVMLLASLAILGTLPFLMRAAGPSRGSTTPVYALDLSGLGDVFTAQPAARTMPRLIGLAGGSLVALSLMLPMPPARVEAPPRASFATFPVALGSWDVQPRTLDRWTIDTLAADDYLDAALFPASGGVPVHLFAAYYADQNAGTGIHSPKACLPASGWEIFEIGETGLDLRDLGYGRFSANRAIIARGTERQLVYYWYEQRGRRIPNEFGMKISSIADGVTRGRRDGAIVRFATPIMPDGGTEAAERRLDDAMRAALVQMPQFVPF